jgi:alanyl-tRNA synthetase
VFSVPSVVKALGGVLGVKYTLSVLTSRHIRAGFLDYFASRHHRVVASSSLVPSDDPTLLFTNAGMNQFKDLFLGKERRDYKRATTTQKCMRVSGKHNDLDNVGPSLRHHTFFEMLGNFSFGDYFKKDALPFAWELLTDVWKLDPERLFPSVFKGEQGIPRDQDSFDVWAKLVPASRIALLGLADNFWQMGDTGPCGPCSEIYYFRGNEIPCAEPICRGVECSCDRYIEIWNNVFMEFDRQSDGTFQKLPALSVDTGMGLERITSVIQGTLATYDTDLFTPILDAIGQRAGRRYTATLETGDHPDVSMRVIADHLRAMTFLIADGVTPSNEWRGYVLRKIMRRAMRHGKKLGFTEPLLHTLVPTVVGEMGEAYPELSSGQATIVRTVRAEEDRFDAVLRAGLPQLEDLLDRTVEGGATSVSGDEVFKLYDSLGVPYDFAEDLASQRGLAIDRQAFDDAMEAQRERARAGGKFAAKKADAGASHVAALDGKSDVFLGYDATEADAVVLAVEPAGEADVYRVYLDRTPFYAEAGGQVSDSGRISFGGTSGIVIGVEKPQQGKPRAHLVRTSTPPVAGTTVRAEVDAATRDATRRNHTATHLLHAALRQRLGPHVRQKGSLVAPDRLRFDFTHDAAISAADRRTIERAVNAEVYRNVAVTTEVKDTQDAIAGGAMALFGEKYGDKVRVVTVAGFSVELCGGTHVRATGDIGPVVITEESGVAAGIRRMEALTGDGAVAWIQSEREALEGAQTALNVAGDQVAGAIARLQADAKRLARENDQLKMKAALGGGGGGANADEAVGIGDIKFIAKRVSGLDKNALRSLSDSLRDRIGRGVVVLAAEHDDKVSILVSVTKDVTDRVKAGQLVKELAPIVGGGGGGRPDFAEAGGKDAAQIDAMLTKARELVAAAIGGPA